MYVCSVPACWRECGRGAVGDGLQCVLWYMDTAGEKFPGSAAVCVQSPSPRVLQHQAALPWARAAAWEL